MKEVFKNVVRFSFLWPSSSSPFCQKSEEDIFPESSKTASQWSQKLKQHNNTFEHVLFRLPNYCASSYLILLCKNCTMQHKSFTKSLTLQLHLTLFQSGGGHKAKKMFFAFFQNSGHVLILILERGEKCKKVRTPQVGKFHGDFRKNAGWWQENCMKIESSTQVWTRQTNKGH